MQVPEYRRGAAYHRVLTDEAGIITGREVCVYPTLWGGGRLCEGVLAAGTYDQEWRYQVLAEAVRAAEVWGGTGSPDGSWTDYRSVHNGDLIPASDNEGSVTEKIKTSDGKTMEVRRSRGSNHAANATEAMRNMTEALRKQGLTASQVADELAEFNNTFELEEMQKMLEPKIAQGQGKAVALHPQTGKLLDDDGYEWCTCGHVRAGHNSQGCTEDGCTCTKFHNDPDSETVCDAQGNVYRVPVPKTVPLASKVAPCLCGHDHLDHPSEGACKHDGCDCLRFYES